MRWYGEPALQPKNAKFFVLFDLFTFFCSNFFFIFSFWDLESFLRTWFRNNNQWYPITSCLRGFNPKTSWAWRQSSRWGCGGKFGYFLKSNFTLILEKFFFCYAFACEWLDQNALKMILKIKIPKKSFLRHFFSQNFILSLWNLEIFLQKA